jgi:predicted HAD superfamily Cof-like phosphohydrolase
MSNYQAVKQFTEESTGIKCPDRPIPLDKDKVKFLVGMCLSELTELCQTVCSSHDEAIKMMVECMGKDPSKQPEYKNDIEIVADQADAMVDTWYYMLNAAAKNGIDLSKVFNAVHQANMDKKDKKTGKFIKRDDGKILKPEGWKPANIVDVLSNDFEEIKFD